MHTLRLALLLVLALVAGPAQAQVGPATDYVVWSVEGPEAPVQAGATAAVRFHATIADGWKMYALDSPRPSRAVEIAFDELGDDVQVEAFTQTEPKEAYDPNFNVNTRTFEHEATITATLRVAPEAAPGEREVAGTITFMICTDRLCLPPTPIPFATHLTVESGAQNLLAQEAPDLIDSGGQAGAVLGSSEAEPVGGAAEKVAWTTVVAPEVIDPGEAARLTLTAAIEPGWKMYAMDSPEPEQGVLRLDLADLPQGLTMQGTPEQSEPKEGYDPFFDAQVRYFDTEAEVGITVQAGEDLAPGRYELSGEARFMVCDDRLCLPPTREPFTAVLAVADETGAVPDAVVASSSSTPGEAISTVGTIAADGTESGGFWGFLLLAVGAGLAALLTPCVFPMIPLTVSYFTKHAGDRSEAVRMAAVYGFAIVLTFTGLGIVMALLLGAAGAQAIAANPWVNLFIGAVFVFFALSLLGLFELRLPSGWLNFMNRQSNEQKGYLGVVFMGLTLTLVSFSCTAPFVGGLLAATAGGAWSRPILGMVLFSATFALPFVLFALFPNGLQRLPRSGSWMNAVKVTLGFVELAAALKFLSNADLVWGWNLLSRPLAIALTAVIFFLAGLYLIGKLRIAHEEVPEEVGVVRLLFAIGFLGLSIYMLPGLFGAPLNALDAYLPPRHATDVSLVTALPQSGEANAHDEGWYVDDIDAAFAEAEAVGKPVFIDFTGYTCTNCRAMEANVFPRSEVAERFRHDFVLLRLYTDGARSAEYQPFQLRLTQTTALPTYAIVAPGTRQVIRQESGMMSVEAFTAFLDRGAQDYLRQNLAARSD